MRYSFVVRYMKLFVRVGKGYYMHVNMAGRSRHIDVPTHPSSFSSFLCDMIGFHVFERNSILYFDM